MNYNLKLKGRKDVLQDKGDPVVWSAQKGQKTGIKIIEMIKIISVSIDPFFIKSENLYLPGPYTNTQAGSRGAIKEQDAATVTPIMNVLGLAFIPVALWMAIGRTSSAAVTLDMGWVRKRVKRKNPPRSVIGP